MKAKEIELPGGRKMVVPDDEDFDVELFKQAWEKTQQRRASKHHQRNKERNKKRKR